MGNTRIRPLIGLVECTFGGGFVGACTWQAKRTRHDLRHDGLAGRGVLPRHQLALCIQACVEAADANGAVEVVLHVFAAAPQRLHRCALHGFGYHCGLGNDVHL